MDKSFHNKYGLLNDHIGFLQAWGWKKEYIFLDFESRKFISNVDPSSVQILTVEEYRKIFDERNYKVPKENEIFDDRQKIYGKIHDNVFIFHNDEGIDNFGYYTMSYCRAVAFMFAMEEYHIEMSNVYGKEYGTELMTKIAELPEQLKEDVRKIGMKHLMGGTSTYDKYCDKMGIGTENFTGEYIPESDVIQLIMRLKKEGDFGNVLKSNVMDCPEIQFLLKQF